MNILRMRFETHWTWLDFQTVVREAVELSKPTGRRVDVIADVSEGLTVPEGAISQFGTIDRLLPDELGLIVVTGGGTFQNMLIELFRKVKPLQGEYWRTAKNLEQARAIIAADRIKEGNHVD
jgi:hypothetical protein